MKCWIGAAVVLLALCGQAVAAPQHVMSLKLCTDALLMDLAPPSHIASVTYLSHEKAALKHWPVAAGLAVNHNTPEEVLAARPDLILTDRYTAPAMKAILARTRARILEVPDANSFDDIRTNVRLVAAALDESPRGETLIAQMDKTLGALDRTRVSQTIRVAGWGGGGYLPGGGLFDAILTSAGATNIAPGGDSYYDLEQLLAAKPDVLLYGDQYADMPSLRDEQDSHPVLLRAFAHRRVTYPSALYGCGVPQSAEAARQLRLTLQTAMRQPSGVP